MFPDSVSGCPLVTHFSTMTRMLTKSIPNSKWILVEYRNPLHIYNELPGYYLTAMLGGKGVIAVNKEKQTSNYAKLINDFFGHMEAPIFNFSNGWF